MNLLAELACARAPTTSTKMESSTLPVQDSRAKQLSNENAMEFSPINKSPSSSARKSRNPIKELFEKKKSNELKLEEDKSLRRAKKKHQTSNHGSSDKHAKSPNRKKRLDERRDDSSSKIKDVYDFDEDESFMDTSAVSVAPFRSKSEKSQERSQDASSVKSDEINMSDLVTKAIDESLRKGRVNDSVGKKLDAMVDKKFKEMEKSIPKTKGALKAFQPESKEPAEEKPEEASCEAKKKKLPEHLSKHHQKQKKRGKKKAKLAWYEDDSSDEFKGVVKAEEDVGVGISKSQRACSKGKQNLFAELTTSTDSEDEDLKIALKKSVMESSSIIPEETRNDSEAKKTPSVKSKSDVDMKKSESEMSDHPLVIDENKETSERQSSDSEDEGNSWDHRVGFNDIASNYNSYSDSESDGKANDDEKREQNGAIKTFDDVIPLEKALDLLDSDKGKSGKDFDEAASGEEMEKDESSELPEKLSGNEKPKKVSDNLPLHVFLSRKVQESKKRKQMELEKQQEVEKEQEKLLMDFADDFQSTRRQRKCAIGKQGLLAEISSSDESDDSDKPRKHKRVLKEKRRERYIEKKHEQMVIKQQKAIEEEILREKRKYETPKQLDGEGESSNESKQRARNSRGRARDKSDYTENNSSDEDESAKVDEISTKTEEKKTPLENKPKSSKAKKVTKPEEPVNGKSKQKKNNRSRSRNTETSSDEDSTERTEAKISDTEKKVPPSGKQRARSFTKTGKNSAKSEVNGKTKSKSRPSSARDSKEAKPDNGDEELKANKSWNKVEEVGVAIGRRKRAAANQLYYWSESSSDEEPVQLSTPAEEKEDDRQEQHGWIVGDSHKKMITMLAMEKQLKRRKSEDEMEGGKGKGKKHRNSTS